MNQPLNCIIIDDCDLDRHHLMSEISKIPLLQNVGSYESCIQAQEKLFQKNVEVVFVDIEMPEISGLNFIRAHQKEDIITIVVSSHPEFALEGFSLQIFDYILKPVTHSRLEACVNRLHNFVQLKRKASAYDILFEDEQFTFKEGYTRINLHLNEVLYLEAYGDYTKIVTTNKTFLTLETLGNLMKTLPQTRFLRVHRSYVVALNKIKKIDLRTVEIGCDNIPIGKTFYKNVKLAYTK